jgi:beta-glucosidase
LETGGPVLMPWANHVAAILQAWYPGSGGADAIADILFGADNPSGRLPVTFPASERDLPNQTVAGMYDPQGTAVSTTYAEGADAGYRWFARTGKTPLYPFGYGLSYSQFKLANLHVEGAPTLTIEFDVTNTGTRRGADTPQAYVTSRAGIPGLRLLGWSKRLLAPGETQHVTLTPDARLLADFSDAWHVPGGKVSIGVGEDSGHLTLTASADVAARDLRP